MWLIFAFLVCVAIYLMLQAPKSNGPDGSIIETPLDVLKERYAKGEIDKEEFIRMKKNLSS